MLVFYRADICFWVEVMVLEIHQLHQMVAPILVAEEVAEATMDPLVVELVVMEDQE